MTPRDSHDAHPVLRGQRSQASPPHRKAQRLHADRDRLAAGQYTVSIDGTKVAEVTAEQLTNGWNMSELTDGPIAAQGKAVLTAIGNKALEVGTVRDLNKFQTPRG